MTPPSVGEFLFLGDPPEAPACCSGGWAAAGAMAGMKGEKLTAAAALATEV